MERFLEIVSALLILPAISIIFSKVIQHTKKEKFTNVLYIPRVYQRMFHTASLMMVAFVIILGLGAGFENTVGHSISVALFILIIEFGAWIIRRYKIVIEGETLQITPMIGRTRSIQMSEITQVVRKPESGLQLYIQHKKVCTIWYESVGYRQFVKMLKEKTLL